MSLPSGAIDIVGSFRSALVDGALNIITTFAPFWVIHLFGVKMGWLDDNKRRRFRRRSRFR